MVSTYEENGENSELIVYKKNNRVTYGICQKWQVPFLYRIQKAMEAFGFIYSFIERIGILK